MKRSFFLRADGNYDVDAASDESAISFEGAESVTQQSFAADVDINTIVRRFGLTGEMPEVVHVPQSGDYTEVVDYRSALDAVNRAREGFMELPAEVRARFQNDPQRLLEFCENPANREEAVKLGIVNLPPEKTRDVVQAVDELREAFEKGAKPAA